MARVKKKTNPLLVIVIVIALFYVINNNNLGTQATWGTGCIATSNEVLFRTNAESFAGSNIGYWIELQFDATNNIETDNLIPYKYLNRNGFCLTDGIDDISIPSITTPNLQTIAYSDSYDRIYIYDSTGCPDGFFTRSWFIPDETVGEGVITPLEPYTSNCQETYAVLGETCSDGIQNQDETGIDCGGVCPACIVTPICGNYLTEAGETCDDGNTVSGDGCDSGCQIEGTCSVDDIYFGWAEINQAIGKWING